jgi:L-ascorbate metabolism protein UlaG (beta-lactamase superfamily)
MKKRTLFNRKKKGYYVGPQSDHYDGDHFFNPWDPQVPETADFIKLSGKSKKWNKKVSLTLIDIPPHHVTGHQLRISFVGHSTMLIQTESINILTDPIWSKRASPFKWFGPKRFSKPGIRFEDLPKIDVILISHNHYDHLDLITIQKLWLRDNPRIIAPLGNDAIIKKKNGSIVVETLDWDESISIKHQVYVHLQPAQHWSARGILDRNKALWGAFVIETKDGNIYFGGDTGYGDGHIFRDVFKKFGKFRLAMLPISPFESKRFMHYAHMNPNDAVLAYKDLGEPYTVAIHAQTFQLGQKIDVAPAIILSNALKKHHLAEGKFRSLLIGESWTIP